MPDAGHLNRLTAEIDRLGEKIQWLEQTDTENKRLLSRAYNELEYWSQSEGFIPNQELINELRKAVE